MKYLQKPLQRKQPTMSQWAEQSQRNLTSGTKGQASQVKAGQDGKSINKDKRRPWLPIRNVFQLRPKNTIGEGSDFHSEMFFSLGAKHDWRWNAWNVAQWRTLRKSLAITGKMKNWRREGNEKVNTGGTLNSQQNTTGNNRAYLTARQQTTGKAWQQYYRLHRTAEICSRTIPPYRNWVLFYACLQPSDISFCEWCITCSSKRIA